MAMAHGSGSLVGRIAEEVVAPGHVTGWWLGGSGFVFKTPGGTQIYVDPYLSDIVRDIFGSARAFPPPIVAEQARPDIVISSHWHEDHLDPGAIPVIAQHSPTTRFIMPPSATAHAAALLAWHLGSGTVIPIHHILWAGGATDDEATLDPALFAETYRKLGGTGRVVIPEIAAPIDFSRDGGTSR